ncbi:serine O-acetyltransferase [uncultured Jatrophihabitans sp.]|uniref:serine O-acetyltransferase n=1 Tax=uncultured Jatrophihabitans sp. TaxID=1610747 RepID=UPI0035CCA63F
MDTPLTNPKPAAFLLWLARRRNHRGLKLVCLLLGGDIGAQDYEGLILPHPYGITIHAASPVGPRCVIYQNVTIGTKHGYAQPPVVGADVVIGANAVIIGPIVIGDGAIIGAGAVVIADVPAHSVVVGNPARVV